MFKTENFKKASLDSKYGFMFWEQDMPSEVAWQVKNYSPYSCYQSFRWVIFVAQSFTWNMFFKWISIKNTIFYIVLCNY